MAIGSVNFEFYDEKVQCWPNDVNKPEVENCYIRCLVICYSCKQDEKRRLDQVQPNSKYYWEYAFYFNGSFLF